MSSHTAAVSVVDILCQLISIPSVNPMGRELEGPNYFEGRVSDWLVDFYKSLNVKHERIEVQPGRDNVIARYSAPNSDLTLLLDAHQDTVPVDGMTIEPFQPQVTDGRITGRGACDVKGGMAAMLHAFVRLVQEQPPCSANVVLSCTCDEEATMQGMNALATYWQEPAGRSTLLAQPPDAAIIAEPTLLDVVIAHKGVTRFCIHTTGRACHSSDPSQGVNAIYNMAAIVQAVQEYASLLNGRVSPHPLCGSPTMSVGRVYGGASVNIVPDECTIEVDRRLIPGESASGAIDDLRTFLAERLDNDVMIDAPWISVPALDNDNNEWLADGLLEKIADVDGKHNAIAVPFGTHASRTYASGIPSVVFGPGSIDQAHTKDEFIEIAQLEKAAEIYYAFCANPPSTN